MKKQILIATHNQGKVEEFRILLPEYEIKSAADYGLPEPEETETSFSGNALLKAKAALKKTGLMALADDSGLSIDLLDGAPGVQSARWAETPQGRDFSFAMKKVNEKIGGIKGHESAHFIAVLALVYPDGTEKTFEGRVNGNLCWPPRGDRGFGYDPIFVPQGYEQTFAEMEPAQKHALSHRAKAVEKLKAHLLSSRA